MFIKIDNINVNYEYINNKVDQTIVFLHGWGQNIEMVKPLGNHFKKEYNVLYIDLPGFGLSGEPLKVYTVYDYALLLNKLLKDLKIIKPILVGHSFGGKISLLYASMYDVHKLVVMGSPYDIEVKKISLKIKILKKLKKLPGLKKLENLVKKHMGSSDYRNASLVMRKVLTDTVNLSIKDSLPKIICPTLIIWGSSDEAISISNAYNLEKLIKNSGVVVYEGATHYAYLERLEQTKKVLKTFFESKE